MSQNVFDDMELPNPDEKQLKAQLVIAIRTLVNRANLSQSEVADMAGLTQPAVSRMLKGMTKEFSVEKLLHVVTSLGSPVRLIIGNANDRNATVSVEFEQFEELGTAAA
jgi:predicted XRE-type DNA-binding protein